MLFHAVLTYPCVSLLIQQHRLSDQVPCFNLPSQLLVDILWYERRGQDKKKPMRSSTNIMNIDWFFYWPMRFFRKKRPLFVFAYIYFFSFSFSFSFLIHCRYEDITDWWSLIRVLFVDIPRMWFKLDFNHEFDFKKLKLTEQQRECFVVSLC